MAAGLKPNFGIPANSGAGAMESVVRALVDIRKILSKNISIGDNMNAAITSVSVTHMVPVLLKNPLKGRPLGVRALSSVVSGGVSGLPHKPVDWEYSSTTGYIAVVPQFDPPLGVAHLQLNTDFTVGNVSHTQIPFDTNRIAPFGAIEHSNTSNTSRIYCMADGVVSVSGYVKWNNNSTGFREIFVCKNGVTDAADARYGHDIAINAGPDGKGAQSFADEVDVSGGDYIGVDCYQTSGGGLAVLGNVIVGQTRIAVRYVAPPVGYSATVTYVIEGG